MIYRIHGYHGGLGDQLQFSTLPQRLTELGHEVYLLKDAYFRNNEIKELVWGYNPYIKGELEGEWNVGDIPGLKYINLCNNFIGNWEMLFGLTPVNTKPIIYYKPKFISELANKTIIDINCISLRQYHNWNKIHQHIQQYKQQPHIEITNTMNIYAYCDMLYSCKKIVCLHSGTQALSVAISRFKEEMNIEVLLEHIPLLDETWNKKLFIFDNVNYIWL